MDESNFTWKKWNNEKAISWIYHRGDGHVMSKDRMWFIVFEDFNESTKSI